MPDTSDVIRHFTGLPSCPYGADTCPQVERMEKTLSNLESRMTTITRLCYVMVGIIAIQTGLVIT